MAYLDLIKKLFRVNLYGGMKFGLENARHLQEQLSYPDRAFETIHVAGTNGKGSVSTKIADTFQQAGYRVGLFTSPHISSFRERIRINGNMISETAIENHLSFLFNLVERLDIPATFFELTTFLAFLYFREEKVDVAVIETGLGGRLDATNVIHPCLSVITSISLDHTEILGTTEEAIAYEKGGIIKEKTPVIIGPRVPFQCIRAIASNKESECIQVSKTSLLFEEENRWIAREALHRLSSHFHFSPQAIEKGLEGRQPCRFEVLQGPPLVILDVAHNPDGLKRLFFMVRYHYPSQPIRVLFGLSQNKDIKTCLQVISSESQYFHIIEALNGRGASPVDLQNELSRLSISSTSISIHSTIAEGIHDAYQKANSQNQILLICGSFFIMQQARKALGIIEPTDELDLNEAKKR